MFKDLVFLVFDTVLDVLIYTFLTMTVCYCFNLDFKWTYGMGIYCIAGMMKFTFSKLR